jgi:hypothetical protein
LTPLFNGKVEAKGKFFPVHALPCYSRPKAVIS